MRSLCGLLLMLCMLTARAAAADEPVPVPVKPVTSADADADAVSDPIDRFFAAMATLSDYEVLMSKQQRINGAMARQELIYIRQRREPACRFLRWTGDVHHGREMIWCTERYNGKVQIHEPGALGLFTFRLAPDDPMLRRSGELHALPETGLYMLAELVRKDADDRKAHPERPPPAVRHESVDGVDSVCVDAPEGADLFPVYHAGRRALCLDPELNLPTQLQVWNTAGELMESYTYKNYIVNGGLSDKDFDVDNPAYHF